MQPIVNKKGIVINGGRIARGALRGCHLEAVQLEFEAHEGLGVHVSAALFGPLDRRFEVEGFDLLQHLMHLDVRVLLCTHSQHSVKIQ